ncbi:MAG: hypothetical protein EHM47_07375, partial [Ignavibacteriales bacterium]
MTAQCSDAGACQVGHLSVDDTNKLQFSLSFTNGYSGKEDDVSFNSLKLNTQYEILDGSRLSLIVPYNFQSGPLGNVNGIGDLILSWSQNLFISGLNSLNASIGIKLAAGDENKSPELPQVYQPGLGTTDFILTVDYQFDKASIGLGYQIAGGRNEKDGLKLMRGDDFIARALYQLSFDNFNIVPQFLFIKRLSKSTILNQNVTGENFIEVDKSDQPQLNFIGSVQYNINDNYALTAEAAVPFLQREINIDGLKRA